MNKAVRIGLLLFLTALSACTQNNVHEFKRDKLPHHTRDGFQNPYLQSSKRGFFNYIKMRYFSDETFADYDTDSYKVPTVRPNLNLIHSPGDRPQVTWLGHATVLIQYKGKSILTDPMFSDRASPVMFFGPKRVIPPSMKIEELPAIDLVIISHNHYDHLDTQSVRQIGGNTVWLVPLGLKEWFSGQDIPEENVREFDWWDRQQFENITVTATPAQHWSARAFWDRNETLWSSWMVQIDDFIFWYSGDTGYNPFQFKEIGERFAQVDLALISIGAYAPRWFMKDVHINPDEAVQIHLDIHARQSLAVQWGTFPLTAEPIDEPPKKLRQALEENNIDPDTFDTMKIGEMRMID